MPTVSLCMIAKNEEEVLARCLESVAGFPDEIILVDTGSTDKTVEVAQRFGAKVFHFKWINDFAAARNFSFSKATCDYIFWLDCDDIIKPEELVKLIALKPHLSIPQYIMWYDYSQDPTGRSEMMLPRERLMRRDCNFVWRYPIHECIDMHLQFQMTDIVITHKRTGAGVAADSGRNIVMLETAIQQPEYKDDPRIHYYLAKECQDHDQCEKAVKWFEKFIAMPGGWWEDKLMAHGKLAQVYLRWSQKETDPAKKSELQQKTREAAFKAINVDYRIAEPYYVLGMLSWDLKQWHQAAHWFEICGSLEKPGLMSPLGTDIYTWLPHLQATVMYYNLGNNVKANWHNEEAAKFIPKDSRIIFNRKLLHDILHPKKKPEKLVKLNLGSGSKRYKDFISCDLFPGKEIDEVFSLKEIPYADGTVQSIHSEHALEHLWHKDARDALREWYRVLVPGGDVHLQIPDLKQCCEGFINAVNRGDKAQADWFRWTIYGAQEVADPKSPEGQIHYTGFSLEEIRRELEDVGFVIDFIWNYDGFRTPSTELRAVKPVSSTRIGWVATNRALEWPQFRIRTFQIDRELRSHGFISKIISATEIGKYDIIVLDQAEAKYADEVRRQGKVLIANVCESLFEFGDWFTEFLQKADHVVCCSHALEERVKLVNPRTTVIEDVVENSFEYNCTYTRETTKLKVGCAGMGGSVAHVEKLRPIIEKLGYELVTIHEHPGATIKWNLNTWQKDLATCDIAIIPSDVERQPCKSNNRLTTCMSIGLPTIASPLDAYTRIINQGENGYIAYTDQDWERYLKILESPAIREMIGQAGKKSARPYSLNVIGQRWIDVLLKNSISYSVDIIVTTYGGGVYLDQCLKSIESCTDSPHRVIVVDAKPEGLNFSQAINRGLRQSTSQYVCLLNDDTIVSKGWLRPLVEQIKDNVGLVNPLSNCDKRWLHNYNLNVGGVDLGPGTTMLTEAGLVCAKSNPNITVDPKSIYEFKSPSTKIYTRDWVPFFCTVISRGVINAVGLLDEEFKTGSEDLDYCTRANKLGFKCAVNEGSFVYHAGGVSRKAHEDQDYAKHQEEDRYNQGRIRLKYDKPLIVIHSGLAWSNWNARTLYTEGLGGSETWAIRMSEEFAKLGCRVVCFGPMQDEIYNGVEWKNQEKWNDFLSMNWIDVCIISRYPQFLESDIKAGKKYLMVHDVHPMNDNGLTKKHIESGNLNGVLCLSTWHRDYVSQVCNISKEKIILIKNGVDLGDFNEANMVK